jgi:hypothetical protein
LHHPAAASADAGVESWHATSPSCRTEAAIAAVIGAASATAHAATPSTTSESTEIAARPKSAAATAGAAATTATATATTSGRSPVEQKLGCPRSRSVAHASAAAEAAHKRWHRAGWATAAYKRGRRHAAAAVSDVAAMLRRRWRGPRGWWLGKAAWVAYTGWQAATCLMVPPTTDKLVDERQRLRDLRLRHQQLPRKTGPPRHEVLKLEEDLPALVRRQAPNHFERWLPAPAFVVITAATATATCDAAAAHPADAAGAATSGATATAKSTACPVT